MKDSKNAGYDHGFSRSIGDLDIEERSHQSIKLNWTRITLSEECFDGYMLELRSPDGSVLKKMLDPPKTTHEWTDLKPCTEYTASIKLFLGIDDETNEPIFVGKDPEETICIKTKQADGDLDECEAECQTGPPI